MQTIRAGEIKDILLKMEEITIKDIARKCNVGVSTVSRAINNHPDINPKTREMVMAVIRETGYVPNNSARNLKRIDAKCIAVLIKGITNPFFSSVIGIIESHVQKRKYTMVMQHVEAYEDELDVALELVKEKRLRGIVFLGGAYRHDRAKLLKLKAPFVFCTIGTQEQEGEPFYSNVSVDDREESRKMTEYLLSLGHKRIAIIGEGEKTESVGRLRLEGYQAALGQRNILADQRLVCLAREQADPFSMENGYRMTKELLASGADFTALYCMSDFLAVGACRALYEAGKKVPEEISVAGYDGLAIGNFYTPRLTTIRQPVEEMAEKTMEILFRVIEEKSGHEYVIFPGKLVVRESTAGQGNMKK